MDPISCLVNLEMINICENKTKSMRFVKNMRNMCSLNMNSTHIEDINEFKYLSDKEKLIEIRLSSAPVVSIQDFYQLVAGFLCSRSVNINGTVVVGTCLPTSFMFNE